MAAHPGVCGGDFRAAPSKPGRPLAVSPAEVRLALEQRRSCTGFVQRLHGFSDGPRSALCVMVERVPIHLCASCANPLTVSN